MHAKSFDYAPLLRRALPLPAVKWTGSARYNFTGGNNDGDQVPVEDLIVAARTVLEREGRSLRPTVSQAVRRAIGGYANFWR